VDTGSIFLVEGLVIVEIKAVEHLEPIHEPIAHVPTPFGVMARIAY
jgi:hypothetical protein